MYTQHGHHIPDSPDDGNTLPDHKDDCGGIEGCVDCAREAIPFIPIEPENQDLVVDAQELSQPDEETQDENPGFVEPIAQGLPDGELEKMLEEEREIAERHGETPMADQMVFSSQQEPLGTHGDVWNIETGEEPVVGNAARQKFVTDFLNEDRSNFGETDIRDRFGRHEVTDITFPMNAACRGMFIDVAMVLDKVLPPGREKFQALADLEKSEMWALKAIAMLAKVVDE